jgi:hypothetical protein
MDVVSGGGLNRGRARDAVLACGISICSLQVGQFKIIPAPFDSTARFSPQRGQLKQMSMFVQESSLTSWPDHFCRPTIKNDS